jgi:hypothetical protein
VLHVNPFEHVPLVQPQPTPAKQLEYSSEPGHAGPVELVSPTQVQSPAVAAEQVSSASHVVPTSPQRQPVPGKHCALGPPSGHAWAPPVAIVRLHWHWFVVTEQISSVPQTPPPAAPLQSQTPALQIGTPPMP